MTDHKELCLFTENLGKMLADGIMAEKALDIAGRRLTNRFNRKVAAELKTALIKGIDLDKMATVKRLPAFYKAMIRCGQQTGRISESLKSAAQYLQNIIPTTSRAIICWKAVGLACLIGLIARCILLMQIPWIGLGAMFVVFVLPSIAEPTRYCRDYIICKLPFVGTWSKQLAIMEFFICLKIAYESTLSPADMAKHSISAISNG